MEIAYGESDISSVGQLTDGTAVRQLFTADFWHLTGISLPLSGSFQAPSGRVIVQVIDISQAVLGESYVNMVDLTDDPWHAFDFNVLLVKGCSYEIKVFTQNCRSGTSPTISHGRKIHSGHFFLGSKLMRQTELSCRFHYADSATSSP